MIKRPVAVLGTGMAGFGAAYALQSADVPFVCYDKNPYHGGHTHSVRYGEGFVFDDGVHISFTRDERVKQIFAECVDGGYEEKKFVVDNYWRGHRIPHPVQCNLRTLPTDLKVKIITDFVAAGGQAQRSTVMSNNAGTGTEQPVSPHPRTYAEWLYAVYGRTFAETFPIPYGRKYHAVEMDQLTTDWIGPRMYRPALEEILRGSFEAQGSGAHYIESFRYPLQGGFVGFLGPFTRKYETKLNHRLVRLDPRQKLLYFSNGESHRYSVVISSIPLPDLIPMIAGVPSDVVDAAAMLAFSSVVLFNIGVGRPDFSDAATTYFYDEDVMISRVSLPHLLSPHNAPQGCGSIQAEVYFSEKYKPLRIEPAALMDTVIRDLRRCELLREDDAILLKRATITRYANVIYDHHRTTALETVHGFLRDVGIHYCGRFGKWNHAWTDQAFLNGEETAQAAAGDTVSI